MYNDIQDSYESVSGIVDWVWDPLPVAAPRPRLLVTPSCCEQVGDHAEANGMLAAQGPGASYNPNIPSAGRSGHALLRSTT